MLLVPFLCLRLYVITFVINLHYLINFSDVELPGSSISTSENISTKLTEGTSTTTKGSDITSPGGASISTSKESEHTITSGSESTHETTPIFSTEGTTTTIILPEPPKVQPPLIEYPNYYPTTKPPRKRPERVSSETSEIVALIIGIIAGVLIAIILVILLILRFKSRGERSYKVDDGKGYQQGPNAALLGNTSGTNGQTQYQVNGALRNGDKSQLQKSKKRDSKDIKEWYV